MANSNGIFKRGSSHYLRVVLPKTHQLINAYKSGKVIVSLGLCSYREAHLKHSEETLEAKAERSAKSAMFRYLTDLGSHCNMFYKGLKT
jgi:hypothetical protein